MSMAVAKARVLHAANLVEPLSGRYSSFPSLAQDPATGDIVVLYRQAQYNEADPRPGMRAHGLDGSLWIQRLNPYAKRFEDTTCVLVGEQYAPGLIDGFLTSLDGKLRLVARRFLHQESLFYVDEVHSQGLNDAIRVGTGPVVGPVAWGRLFKGNGERWYQVLYGARPEDLMRHQNGEFKVIPTCPSIIRSDDQGQSWQFHNWITPTFFEGGLCANETTLLALPKGWITISRTASCPTAPFYVCESGDEGQSWSYPRYAGLNGEAPLFYTDPKGKHWLAFRGFDRINPSRGCTFSVAQFYPDTMQFGSEQIIETYTGGHYDGGYGYPLL